jgi:hypothetical protein
MTFFDYLTRHRADHRKLVHDIERDDGFPRFVRSKIELMDHVIYDETDFSTAQVLELSELWDQFEGQREIACSYP